MKATLTAIKAALQGAASLDYFRDDDIFITPDADYVPRQVKMPCIGIKDGAIRYDLDYGADVKQMDVEIAVFAEILRNEQSSIIGDGTRKGILEIADDVIGVLNDNLLSASLRENRILRETAGKLFASDTSLAVQKVLTFGIVK